MFEYFLKAAPQFLLYMGVAIVLTVGFLVTYSAITPQREFVLIREGKLSASLSLIGALLGFVIPLGVVIQHSVSIPDLITWGVVVLAVQVVTFLIARLAIPNLSQKITDGDISAGLFTGGVALAVGLLNASCMVP
jgi:putative membrane protein